MGTRIEGWVGCRGEPDGVPGVLVSDGAHVVVTDPRGRFALPDADPIHPIFISPPAGYRPVDGFFRHWDGAEEMDFPLAHEPRRADPEHAFVLLADYQWEPNEMMRSVFEGAMADPASPEFLVHVGDLFTMMEGAPVHVARRYYDDYALALLGFDFPVFNLIGNHDQVNGPCVSPEMPEFADGLYEELLGPTYYSFNWGDVHYVVLNPFQIVDKEQHSCISDRQLEWLRQDLAYQPADRPLILFAHRAPTQWENEEALLNVLEGRKVLACFAGDWHRDAVFQCPGEPFPTIITVSPKENVYGMPPGYRIVEVKGDRVRHTYRVLGEGGAARPALHTVRPAPGSAVDGDVEIVVTEHTWSDRKPAPAVSADGTCWTYLQPDPFPGDRIAGCNAYWARWRGVLKVKDDVKVTLRPVDDYTSEEQLSFSLRHVPSPVLWMRRIEQSGDVSRRSQPAVTRSRVVIGEDGGIRAFSAESGDVVWQHAESAHWLGTPLVVDDRAIVTSWEGETLALGLDEGNVIWRASQSLAVPPTQPRAAERGVLVGGMKPDGIWDGSLTCLDLETGELCWRRRYDHPFFGRPIYRDGRVWAAAGDVVVCLDAATGEEIWAYCPEHFSIYGDLVAISGRLFAPDIDGWTYVLDLECGEPIDRLLLLRGTGLASDGTTLFAASGVGGLRAYDPISCEEKWRLDPPGVYFIASPTVTARGLLATSSDGNVYLVNPATGQDVWSFQFGDVSGARVAVGGQRAYVITGKGQLIAFSLPEVG